MVFVRQIGCCDLDEQVNEGICEVLGYMWMGWFCDRSVGSLNKSTKQAQFTINLKEYQTLQLKNNAHELYGEGFRKAMHAVTKYGFKYTVDHIVEKGSLPAVKDELDADIYEKGSLQHDDDHKSFICASDENDLDYKYNGSIRDDRTSDEDDPYYPYNRSNIRDHHIFDEDLYDRTSDEDDLYKQYYPYNRSIRDQHTFDEDLYDRTFDEDDPADYPYNPRSTWLYLNGGCKSLTQNMVTP